MRRGAIRQEELPHASKKPRLEVSQPIDSRVRWVAECLRQSNLARHVRIEELAHSVHMSNSRLRHLFRGEIGVTPTRYLKLLRLERAKHMIENSFLEIKEIATAVGFGDVSHFVRDYKSLYGERPSQTRVRKKAG